MAHAKPLFSKADVNRAGDILSGKTIIEDSFQFDWAMGVLSNWRACHAYPINTFQATLRQKLKKIDPPALVAQRLKRTPSIAAKLKRYPDMRLSRMQDIGGLRAVVSNVQLVRKLAESYELSQFEHTLSNKKDYIAKPKSSGYRGIHLVYKYNKPSNPTYNGLQLELQIRTRLQHAWATAVETAEIFLKHALKSSQGPKDWLDFFSVAGSAFALLEGCPPVPQFSRLTEQATFRETIARARKLRVDVKLRAYTLATKTIIENTDKGDYYLLILHPIARTLSWSAYTKERLAAASKAYAEAEARIQAGEPLQVVLVAANSVEALQRAYPNYFLDTNEFLDILDSLRSGKDWRQMELPFDIPISRKPKNQTPIWIKLSST